MAFKQSHLTDLEVFIHLGKGRASTVSVCCETVPLIEKKRQKDKSEGEKKGGGSSGLGYLIN